MATGAIGVALTAADGVVSADGAAHPAEVPTYRRRCWSFIDGYHNWPTYPLSAGKTAALFKAYKLVATGSRIARSWFKVGREWFWAIWGPDEL